MMAIIIYVDSLTMKSKYIHTMWFLMIEHLSYLK